MIPSPNCNQQSVVAVSYMYPDALDRVHDNDVLALIGYGGLAREQLAVPCPVAAIALSGPKSAETAEVWLSADPVTVGQQDHIAYSLNGDALFGVCQLHEPTNVLLDSLIHQTYRDILGLIRHQGYPCLLRMWNYLPAIGERQKQLDRYQRFCMGRYQALAESDPKFEDTLPAASVIGTSEPGITICFLAARERGIPVENPRQTSAYHYPRQYSPRSPSFSRAMVKAWGSNVHLYLSGTASIVGHETCHPENLEAQVNEILRNTDAVLEEANRLTGEDFRERSRQRLLKIFVRRLRDVEKVRDMLTQQLEDESSVLYLHGDLCRPDLLLEIEAVYTV